MLDTVLTRHGNIRSICDVTSNILRTGLDFFGPLCVPLAPSIIARLTQAFQLTNLSSYMWGTSKMTSLVQQPQPGDAVYDALGPAFEQQSQHLFSFFSSNPLNQNEDSRLPLLLIVPDTC